MSAEVGIAAAPGPATQAGHAEHQTRAEQRNIHLRELPKGWKGAETLQAWQWFAQPRPPLPIMVVGAEGGVGTSIVTALLAETIAAASPGPTVAVDQSGTPWGSLSRRLLDERGGFPAYHVQRLLGSRTAPGRILEAVPTSSAGAAVIDDGPAYTPLPALFRLVQAVCGVMVSDNGRVDVVLPARLDVGPLLVVVGRADTVGAEAVCAALRFLHGRRALAAPPLVVLTSPAPPDRRRVHAARTLVRASGLAPTQVYLPYDAQLAAGQLRRLDQAAKATARAGGQLLAGIIRTRGGNRT